MTTTTLRDAAERLGISRQAVSGLINRGVLEATRARDKDPWAISEDSLAGLVQQRANAAALNGDSPPGPGPSVAPVDLPRLDVLEQRMDAAERSLEQLQLVLLNRPTTPPGAGEPTAAAPTPTTPTPASGPTPVLSRQTPNDVITEVMQQFTQPGTWARGAEALAPTPDGRLVKVRWNDPQATIFSLPSMIAAVGQHVDPGAAQEAERRIGVVAAAWWNHTYPGHPVPSLQDINDRIDGSQLMAILQDALNVPPRGGA